MKRNDLYDTPLDLRGYLPSGLKNAKLQEWAVKRGKKLTQIREYVGEVCVKERQISLERFAKSLEMNPITLEKLENGYTCLSTNVASWIARQVLQTYGVFVTSNWLLGLSDKGSPQIIKIAPTDFISFVKNKHNNKNVSLDEKGEEIFADYVLQKMYSHIHPHSLQVCVRDNKMSPIYEKGETVIGSIIDKSDYATVLKFRKKCIIMCNNSIKLVRFISFVNNHSLLLSCVDRTEHEIINSDNVIVALINCKFNFDMREGIEVHVESEDMHSMTLVQFKDII